MPIENIFGDLDKIDILAETKTGEVVMVLVCNGFIDGQDGGLSEPHPE